MIDWNLVSEVAGASFGVTILVLAIMSIAAWLLSLVVQKAQRKASGTETKEKE